MSLPPDSTLEDVKVRITRTNKNPNIGKVTQATLKDGPRAFKIATLFEVRDSKADEFHHYSLRIDHISKDKQGWHSKGDRTITLDDSKDKEVHALYMFLAAVFGEELKDQSGEVHLISGSEYAKYENIVKALPNIADEDKLELLKQLLGNFDSSNFADFKNLFEETGASTLQHIAAASRMVEYTAEYKKMERMVNDPATGEQEFQKHLEKNPWMFGSEYSELLPRRTWTRDDNLDYMLRRTVDGYLEIVEIKTALSDALFLHDRSHDSYYPSSKLSPVLGQVVRYIEEVERNRDSIIAKDEDDTLKIRARAIVGRDGSKEHQAALRNFNAHLHRIEIITFDQLLKIAKRVLSVFQTEETQNRVPKTDDFDDDIPF